MNPFVRQLFLTDRDNRVYLRMNCEEQLGYRITSFRSMTVMAVSSRTTVRLTIEHITLAFIDICGDTYIDGFVDGQNQGHDTITTVVGYECVSISASFGIAYTVEHVVCSFAHSVANRIVDNGYHAYVAHVRAIK